MDAKITRQRLSNMLAYDWLKIIASVVAAVLVLTLLFTMVRTRPTAAQTFTLFSYYGMNVGEDFGTLEEDLKDKNTFSYEILEIQAEAFTDSTHAAELYTARRSAGEGTAMLVADTREADSTLLTGLSGGVAYRGGESDKCTFYDTAFYMDDCENYLSAFYDGGLHGTLKTDKVRESFQARNQNDKRYRSDEKREAGIADEQKRIEKLRDDYKIVESAFEAGTLSHITYKTDEGEFAFGISLAKLQMYKLVNAAAEEGKPAPDIALMIFRNDWGAGNDLRFETVSFLRYLLEKYGA